MTLTTTAAATAREAREFLLSQPSLPAGVEVGQRGRLSRAAKDHYTALTGRVVVSPTE